jgi:hypothetical protein
VKFKKHPLASDGSRLFLCWSEDVFALLSVFLSSAAEKTPPDFLLRKSGGVDALLVLFQALTQNLAKIFMQQPLRLTSWGQRISGAALPKRCH